MRAFSTSYREIDVTALSSLGARSLPVNVLVARGARESDARDIRMAALANRVTYYTTIAGGRAAVEGIKHLTDAQVCSLQEMYAEAAKA